MAVRLEKKYITRLTKCLNHFFNTEQYVEMIIIVVPLLKASNNKEQTMKAIEEMSIKNKDNPQAMLTDLNSLKV